MGFALINSVSVQGPGNFTSAAIDTTGATLLVLAVSYYIAPPTVSDSKGNTPTQIVDIGGGAAEHLRLYYYSNPTVGSGHTFTVDAGYHSSGLLAFSGAVLSSVLDQNSGTIGSSQPGSITPTENNEVIVSAAGAGFGSSCSVDSGFTKVFDIAFGGGDHLQLGMGYKIQTTAGAVNPTWTGASGGAVQASFKALSGGPQTLSLAGSVTPGGAVAKASAVGKAGTVTPAATIAKLAARVLTGSMSPTATIAKLVSKISDGSLTPASVIAKFVSRRTTGSVTPTGAVATLKLILLALGGLLVPVGTVRRNIVKQLAGNLTPAASLLRAISKRLTGLITAAGTILTQVLGVEPARIDVDMSAAAVTTANLSAAAVTAVRLRAYTR